MSETNAMIFTTYVANLSKGNPGAIQVMMQLLGAPNVNEDSLADGIEDIRKMEAWGLIGSNFWLAYKDICKEDIEVLREKIRDGSIEKAVKDLPDYERFD